MYRSQGETKAAGVALSFKPGMVRSACVEFGGERPESSRKMARLLCCCPPSALINHRFFLSKYLVQYYYLKRSVQNR